MKPFVAALCSVLLAACSPDDAVVPSAKIGGNEACAGDVTECLAREVTERTVSGVDVVHARVRGDPVVAVRVLFDAQDRGGLQLWAEEFALQIFAFEGKQGNTVASWDADLSTIGASVGAGAGVDYDTIAAYAPIAYWDTLWKYVTEALAQPAIEEYLLMHLKSETDHDYSTELDEPAGAAAAVAYSNAFSGTPSNRFRDSQRDAQRVSMANLVEAWASLLTKERLHVVVVGDMSFADVSAKVAQAFGGITARHTPDFPGPPPEPGPPTASKAVVLDYPDSPNWQIQSVFRGPAATDADFPALAVAMRVLDLRLFDEVREARGLAYSVSASLRSNRVSYGSFQLATVAPSQALPVVKDIVQGLVDTPPGDDEMSAARALLRSDLLTSARTPPAIASMLGASLLVRDDPLGVRDVVASADAVTAEDARRALSTYMRNVSIAAAGAGEPLDETALLAVVPSSGADAGP